MKAEPGAQSSEEREYKPRYVALPIQRERGHGRRNLVLGVLLFAAAIILLSWAVLLAGATALLTLGACIVTAMLLQVMARSRLLRQRNGGFVAWGSVCMLAVFLVILHHGWLAVAHGFRQPDLSAYAGSATPLPTASSTPATSSLPPPRAALPAESPSASKLPLLSKAFPDSIAAPNAGPAVRITTDTPVTVAGKEYLAKADDFYLLGDVGIGEVTIVIGKEDVTLPMTAAEIAGGTGPASERLAANGTTSSTPRRKGGFQAPESAQETDAASPRFTEADAMRETTRRYPNVGIKGSVENRLFLTAVKEQRSTGELDFFKDPSWPITLADLLAQQEGWKRADGSSPSAPTSTGVDDELSTSSASSLPGTSGSRRSP